MSFYTYNSLNDLNLAIGRQFDKFRQIKDSGDEAQIQRVRDILESLRYERSVILGWRGEKHELIEWLEDGHQVTSDPTYGQWREAALQFVKTGKDSDKKKMLKLVSLDHVAPNLSDEFHITEPVKKPTAAEQWYASRWLILIFILWTISIVVGFILFA